MPTYISKEFISDLEALDISAWEERSEEKRSIIDTFKRILSSGEKVVSDVEQDLLIAALKNTSENSFIQKVFKLVYKSNKLKIAQDFSPIDIRGLYFKHKNMNLPFNEGILSVTNPLNVSDWKLNPESKLSWNISQSHIPKSSNYENLVSPPTSSLIYIDNYCFKSKKVEKLINWIKSNIPSNLSPRFQLTILTVKENAERGALEKFKQVVNEIQNIDYEIFLLPKKLIRDRVYITNYTYGQFSHPFDDVDDHCIHNQLFIPLPAGNSNREIVQSVKELINKIIKKTDYFTHVKYKNEVHRNTEFENRLISRYNN